MARDNNGQQPRKRVLEPPVHARRHFFFAGVGAGRQPQWPVAEAFLEFRQNLAIGGQGRNGELQVADVFGVAGTETTEAFGVRFGLSQTQVEPFEQPFNQAAEPLPARERPRRYSAVDQDHRYFPVHRFDDQVGPEFRFRPQRQVRTPVIEKPPDVRNAVDRNILVESTLRQPLRHQPGRRHGAGCHQDANAGYFRDQTPD